MQEFFWSTSNPKKTGLSILLLKISGPEARWKDIDAHPPISSIAGTRKWPLIFWQVVAHLELFHEYLMIIIQVVVEALYERSRKVLSLYMSFHC